MINELGENLDVLILTETGEDWQAFATWYSASKNIPQANLMLLCTRNQQVPFQYFQWAKRLNLKHRFTDVTNREDPFLETLHKIRFAEQLKWFINPTLLVIRCPSMFVDVLDDQTLDVLNTSFDILENQHLLVSKIGTYQPLIDAKLLTGNYECEISHECLIHEAKDADITRSITSFSKGCGGWINTMKGCPFSSAGNWMTDDMTVNEIRAIDLWRKMATLYSAVQ
jgi:hypothetical protein